MAPTVVPLFAEASQRERAVPASGVYPVPLPHESRLRKLVDEHADFVWRCLRRRGLTEADAEDAAQEVFLVLARKLDDVEQGKERGFLFSTATNIGATRRRSVARQLRMTSELARQPSPFAPSPELAAERRRGLELLDSALDEMTDGQRVVFTLFELEDLTVPEIAGTLGVPEGTVASRLRRARESFSASIRRFTQVEPDELAEEMPRRRGDRP